MSDAEILARLDALEAKIAKLTESFSPSITRYVPPPCTHSRPYQTSGGLRCVACGASLPADWTAK